jgi:hypothetical protein
MPGGGTMKLGDNLTAAQELLGNAMGALEAIDEQSEHVRRALLAMDEAARMIRREKSYRESPPHQPIAPMYGA